MNNPCRRRALLRQRAQEAAMVTQQPIAAPQPETETMPKNPVQCPNCRRWLAKRGAHFHIEACRE
jgi:hypothetical protein